MKYIDVSVQDGWLRRRGLRGRWLTIYLHRYDGAESTERFHSHPWLFSFGIVLKGRFTEILESDDPVARSRRAGSIGCYTRKIRHRVASGEGLTVFIGLSRSQPPIARAAEMRTAEGFCHYSELEPSELDESAQSRTKST